MMYFAKQTYGKYIGHTQVLNDFFVALLLNPNFRKDWIISFPLTNVHIHKEANGMIIYV